MFCASEWGEKGVDQLHDLGSAFQNECFRHLLAGGCARIIIAKRGEREDLSSAIIIDQHCIELIPECIQGDSIFTDKGDFILHFVMNQSLVIVENARSLLPLLSE